MSFYIAFLENDQRKSFSTLPYIKGVTEPLARVLKRKHDVTVVNKSLLTRQQQFPAPTFRPSLDSQANIRYKISLCQLFVVLNWKKREELSRPEKKKYFRHVRTATKGSTIANHDSLNKTQNCHTAIALS